MDYIVLAVEEKKELYGDWYSALRTVMAGSVWKPAEIEQDEAAGLAKLAESLTLSTN